MLDQIRFNAAITDIKMLIIQKDNSRRWSQIILEDDSRLLRIKHLLNKYPELLSKELTWEDAGNIYSGNILHMASFYDHPALMKDLVKNQGMDPDGRAHNGWTPFHHAAKGGASLAVVELMFYQNADPSLKNDAGETPHDLCETESYGETWLRFDGNERMRAQSASEVKRAEAAQKVAAAKGTWTVISPDSLVHVHETEGEQPKRLMDAFNLAEKNWTRISTDMQSGEVTQEERSLKKAQIKELKEQMFVQYSNKNTAPKMVPRVPVR